MDIIRVARDENVKKVEWVLWHESEIRDALEEAVKSVPMTGGAPSGHAYISDRTAAQAIKLADGVPAVEFYECARGGRMLKCANGCRQYQKCLRTLDNPAQWLTVCGAVFRYCERDPIRREVFRRRYSHGRTRRAARIAESTYYFVLGEIRSYALQAAAQVGVIRVF